MERQQVSYKSALIAIRKEKTDEGMPTNSMDGSATILLEIKVELDRAAKLNPCPGCKHDIEQLSKYMSEKAESIQKGLTPRRELMKSLKELDFVNELTIMAITISKIARPFTKTSKVPEVYVKVLHDDMEANKEVREHLLKARELTKGLKSKEIQLKLILDVLDGFIKATEFKLNIDPFMFYLFDRMIKLGYKTHILSATSKVIVGVKGIIDPSRYG